MPITMTDEQKRVVRDLRNAGFAVVIWHPEELGTLVPRWVEDKSIEFGHSLIHGGGMRYVA